MSKKEMKEFQRMKLEAELQKQKKNRKSIDDLHKELMYMITSNFLDNSEIAAMLTATMYATLHTPENRKALESLGVDVDKAGVDAVLSIQRLWTIEYQKQHKEGKA
ncbi:MAG: hypothetical protein ACRC3H_02630 [Lachnospiraceae bacterium]